jgi:hypothetical protein
MFKGLVFLILNATAIPQPPVVLNTNMGELINYKWVCREHNQLSGVSTEDTVCRWARSTNTFDFNGALDTNINLILLVSVLISLQ